MGSLLVAQVFPVTLTSTVLCRLIVRLSNYGAGERERAIQRDFR